MTDNEDSLGDTMANVDSTSKPRSLGTKSHGPEQLDALLEFVEQILGKHFQGLFKRSERARKLLVTSHVPHRLVYLYERLLISKRTINEIPKKVDFLAITELQFLKDMFERWEGTDVWDEISSEIVNRTAYVHCILLLAWVTAVRGGGSRVALVPKEERSGKRIADARIFNNFGEFLSVELKAPQILHNPNYILDPEEAYRVVNKAWRMKGSGANKQIGESPSLLMIGGFFLRDENLGAIRSAVEAHFKRVRSPYIAGVIILTIMLAAENVELQDGVLKIFPWKSIFRVQLSHRTIPNPSYTGNLPLEVSESPTASYWVQQTVKGVGTGFNNTHEDV